MGELWWGWGGGVKGASRVVVAHGLLNIGKFTATTTLAATAIATGTTAATATAIAAVAATGTTADTAIAPAAATITTADTATAAITATTSTAATAIVAVTATKTTAATGVWVHWVCSIHGESLIESARRMESVPLAACIWRHSFDPASGHRPGLVPNVHLTLLNLQ